MNMLLHGVKDTEFEIFHVDTLTNEWDTLRELNPTKKTSFDAMVANPLRSNAEPKGIPLRANGMPGNFIHGTQHSSTG